MLLQPGLPSIAHFRMETHPVHSVGSPSLPRPRFTRIAVVWCRIIQPACHRLRRYRPRLRTRLTLGRLTLPRNPQAFGGVGSHNTCATHSGIRTSLRSTSPLDLASLRAERSPTILPLQTGFTASVRCLSLGTFSVPAHSTSELLRTLSMVAASKPTSWLS